MGYDGQGNSSRAGVPILNGTSIDAQDVEVPIVDIYQMLGLALIRDGRAPLTGPMNFNGQNLSNGGSAAFSTLSTTGNASFASLSVSGATSVNGIFNVGPSQGPRVDIVPGNTTPGYVAFFGVDNLRKGYFGFEVGTNKLGIASEGGWNWSFTQNPEVNGALVACVNNQSSTNATSFPLGTTLLSRDLAADRNQSITLYYMASNTTSYTTTPSGNVLLAGVWRACGSISAGGFLCQRIS
jgi:hypothetical protein